MDALNVCGPTVQPLQLRKILALAPQNYHISVQTSWKDTIPYQAVVLDLILRFFPAKSDRYAGPPIVPMVKKAPLYQPARIVPYAKTRKSCQRWSQAIIQRQWDTAWDLTTHRNIEDVGSWVWPTRPKPYCNQHRQLLPIFQYTMPTTVMASVPPVT